MKGRADGVRAIPWRFHHGLPVDDVGDHPHTGTDLHDQGHQPAWDSNRDSES